MVQRRQEKRSHCLLVVAIIALVSVTSIVAQTVQSSKDNSDNRIPLLNTQWNLVTLYEKPVVSYGRVSHFTLEKSKEVAGAATGNFVAEDTVNGFTGMYEISDQSLRMHISTMGAVAERVRPKEQSKSFVDALRATSHFQIYGSTLELLDQNGEVLARLIAANSRHGTI